MTEREAIERLIELAKARIQTIDGEWGCCHDFDAILNRKRERNEWDDPDDDLTIACPMYEEAVEVAELAAVLGVDVRTTNVVETES